MAVTVGIIGAGGIAQTHAEILYEHDRTDIAAVCDIDPESARALATAVETEAYTDYRTLFRERELDGVYLTTPPQTRTEIVRTAGEHGVGVFCEKPLATTVEDGRAIRDVVERYDIPFMIGFCSRFAEPCRRLRELLADGALGDPVVIFSHRGGYGVPEDDDWRVDTDQACGITVESASHNIDLLRWLGGGIETASGRTTNMTRPDLDTYDDNVLATIGFEDGPIGLLQNSWTSHVEYLRHGVIGTEGAAVVDGDDWWRLDRLTWSTDAAPEPTTVSFNEETATEMGYSGENDAFVESIEADTAPPVDVYDGLRALEVSHAIRSSDAG